MFNSSFLGGVQGSLPTSINPAVGVPDHRPQNEVGLDDLSRDSTLLGSLNGSLQAPDLDTFSRWQSSQRAALLKQAVMKLSSLDAAKAHEMQMKRHAPKVPEACKPFSQPNGCAQPGLPEHTLGQDPQLQYQQRRRESVVSTLMESLRQRGTHGAHVAPGVQPPLQPSVAPPPADKPLQLNPLLLSTLLAKAGGGAVADRRPTPLSPMQASSLGTPPNTPTSLPSMVANLSSPQASVQSLLSPRTPSAVQPLLSPVEATSPPMLPVVEDPMSVSALSARLSMYKQAGVGVGMQARAQPKPLGVVAAALERQAPETQQQVAGVPVPEEEGCGSDEGDDDCFVVNFPENRGTPKKDTPVAGPPRPVAGEPFGSVSSPAALPHSAMLLKSSRDELDRQLEEFQRRPKREREGEDDPRETRTLFPGGSGILGVRRVSGSDPIEPQVGREVGQKIKMAYAQLQEKRQHQREVLSSMSGSGFAAGEVDDASRLPTLQQRVAEGGEHFRAVHEIFTPKAVQETRRPVFKQPEDPHILKVAVIGRPNIGKSYLVNNLVADHICPVSPRPFTSRSYTLGVTTQGNRQLLLLDTPPLCPKLPQLEEKSYRPSPLAFKETTRRLLTTEASWEALHSADAVLLVLDGAAARLSEEDERLLSQLQARLDALDVKKKVFAVMTRLDLAPEKFTVSSKAMYQEILATSPVAFDGVYSVSRDMKSTFVHLRKCLLDHCQSGPHSFPEGAVTDMTLPEIVENRVLEYCMRDIRTERNISAKYLTARVVGWADTVDKDGGTEVTHIDVVITVGDTHLLTQLIEKLSTITKRLHQNVPSQIKREKIKLHYHIQKTDLRSWTLDNPYGHFKPHWRFNAEDFNVLFV